MINKKAQLTLFVIVAIIAVSVIAIVFYGKNAIDSIKEAGMPEQAKSAKNIVDECMKTSAKNSVKIVSLQGGYLAPNSYFEDLPYHIAYWYENSDVSPSIAVIENELSDTMCAALIGCVDLEEKGIEAEYGICEAKTEIRDNYVDFKVMWPVLVTAEDKTYELREFSARIPVKMKKAYEAAKEITEEHSNNPSEICITCVTDIGSKYNLFTDIGSTNDNDLIATLTDEESTIDDNPYKFKFALATE